VLPSNFYKIQERQSQVSNLIALLNNYKEMQWSESGMLAYMSHWMHFETHMTYNAGGFI
jgi:hypothetical protein